MADSKRIAELKEKVALLPESPGIYQFLGADGRVIYVGKAKNLKRRVYSYFTSKASFSVATTVCLRSAIRETITRTLALSLAFDVK